MSRPFFSIIIPTFNSEQSIEKCLLSILNQTFKVYEILVIDALSTDQTLNVVNFLSKKNFSKILVISDNDNGIYDAMNKGIKMAKGEWIYFIGSDDQLADVNVLENIYQFINKKIGLHAVYGNVISPRFGGIYAGEFDSTKLYNQNICHQAVFLKKEVFKFTGTFNLKYKMLADYDNNIKWFFNRRVKKSYIDLVIAIYADGGYSSINTDIVFLNDKKDLFLNHHKYLDFDLRISLLRDAYVRAKANHEYYKYIVYKFTVTLLLEFNKLKKNTTQWFLL